MNPKKKELVRAGMLLYAVTDRAWLGTATLYEQVKQALEGGVTFVQIREKELDHTAFVAEAKDIVALCHSYGVPCIINDDVQACLESGADGVHVGQEDMEAGDVRALLGEDRIIGVSAHTPEEARRAQERGADYLGVGAIHSTDTKTGVHVLSYADVQNICASVNIPAVAIGGVKLDNIAQLKGSGVAGVAIVSGIFAAPDITAAARALRQAAEELVKP